MKTKTIRGLLRGAQARLGIRRIFFLPVGRKFGSGCPFCLLLAEASAQCRVPPGTLMVLSREDVDGLCHTRARQVLLKRLRSGDFSCIALADTRQPPDFLQRFCKEHNVALFNSSYDGPYLLSRLTGLIRERVCHTSLVHGVLVNVCGLGLLITGAAGAGKTTCGLELAGRGHTWIADDLIEVVKEHGKLRGSGFGSARHYVSLRNRGICAIEAVSEITRSMSESALDLWCELRDSFPNPGEGKRRRLMNVPLVFSPFPALNVSGNTPDLIEKWAKAIASGKEPL